MLAIVGKSGQFPLHTWLPDAMAGPTPVSALIHAATMVVAGVYLGARVFPVFFNGFSIGDGGINPMAAIGGITVLIGAALAFVQDDIKKVLAYSTISQLGYMVMALGVGAWTAAVFHLFTHAFFKADLFLGAGSVSHSGSHHSFDMKTDMGGLKKYMPQTYKTFVIGTLALAGSSRSPGFWSKDEILANAGHNDYKLFLVVGLIGAFMTAAVHDPLRLPHLPRRVPRRARAARGPARRRGRARPADTAASVEHDAHAHAPHESNRSDHARCGCCRSSRVFAGFLNFPHFSKFEKWFQPRYPSAFAEIPTLAHPAAFNPILATISVLSRHRDRDRRGRYYLASCRRVSAERNALAGAGRSSSSTSTTSTSCTRRSSSAASRVRSPPASTGSTRT